MRFPADCQISRACSDEATRLSLMGAHLDVEKKRLTATDGRILLSIPVEIDEGDESGIVPAEALKEAVKLSRSKAWRHFGPNASIVTAGKVARLLDKREFRFIDMTYPNWEKVLPQFVPGITRTVRLQFDPGLLYELAKAAGHDPKDAGRRAVTLEFMIDGEDDAAQKPMAVTVAGAPAGSIAVLMPMRITSRAPNRIDGIDAAQEEYGRSEDACAE